MPHLQLLDQTEMLLVLIETCMAGSYLCAAGQDRSSLAKRGAAEQCSAVHCRESPP